MKHFKVIVVATRRFEIYFILYKNSENSKKNISLNTKYLVSKLQIIHE